MFSKGKKLIFILGDVHGDIAMLNTFISKKICANKAIRQLAEEDPDFQTLIFQCGDMAYFWPYVNNKGIIRNGINFLPGGRVPIYWCGGNHEDWDKLDSLFDNDDDNIAEVDRGIYFCRFGTTFELPGNIIALFLGGAESVDKKYRLEKMLDPNYPKIWWDQESISELDMDRLTRVPEADWIISHTAPAGFDLRAWISDNSWSDTYIDNTSRQMLEKVRQKYWPSRWFFGHFHKYMDGYTDGCEWQGLADMRSQEQYYESILLK